MCDWSSIQLLAMVAEAIVPWAGYCRSESLKDQDRRCILGGWSGETDHDRPLAVRASAARGGLLLKLQIDPNSYPPGYRKQRRTHATESDGPKDYKYHLKIWVIHDCGSTYLRFLDCESPIVLQHLIKGRHLEEFSKLFSSLISKLDFSIVLYAQTLYLMISSKNDGYHFHGLCNLRQRAENKETSNMRHLKILQNGGHSLERLSGSSKSSDAIISAARRSGADSRDFGIERRPPLRGAQYFSILLAAYSSYQAR
jgi:hypothetical protein